MFPLKNLARKGLIEHWEQMPMKRSLEYNFISRKCDWKCRLQNSGHFVSASMC